MTRRFFTLDGCGCLIDAPAGSHVYDVAELLMEAVKLHPLSIVGFVFNGKIVRYYDEQNADELVEKYDRLMEE